MQVAWNCYKCRYDLCHKCATNTFGQEIYVPNQVALPSYSDKYLECLAGHVLQKTTGDIYHVNTPESYVQCDACKIKHLQNHKYYFHCEFCQYDVCKTCYIQTLQNAGSSEQQIKTIKKTQKNSVPSLNSYIKFSL